MGDHYRGSKINCICLQYNGGGRKDRKEHTFLKYLENSGKIDLEKLSERCLKILNKLSLKSNQRNADGI